MCFHLSLTKTAKQIENRYNAKFVDENNFSPIYHSNGFKYPQHPVITNLAKDEISFFNWGLVPSWVKTLKDAEEYRSYTLNARADTAFEKPSYRTAILKRRCLIPATGFFEWQTVGEKKYPHYITLTDQEIFSFAGIWESWEEKSLDGVKINSFSILTTDANPLMEKIHNVKKRMPVILSAKSEEAWLKNDLQRDEIEKFLIQYPSDKMQANTISKLITSRKENSNVPEVLNKFNYPELNQ